MWIGEEVQEMSFENYSLVKNGKVCSLAERVLPPRCYAPSLGCESRCLAPVSALSTRATGGRRINREEMSRRWDVQSGCGSMDQDVQNLATVDR